VKELILLRGVPGAGKNTVGALFGVEVISADDFFIKDNEYIYDHDKVEEAHAWCQMKTEDCMRRHMDKIAVANTFTREWELKPYIAMAKDHGYRVHTVIVERRHSGANTHGVPPSTIARMKSRFSIHL
jgi:predicted kinase